MIILLLKRPMVLVGAIALASSVLVACGKDGGGQAVSAGGEAEVLLAEVLDGSPNRDYVVTEDIFQSNGDVTRSEYAVRFDSPSSWSAEVLESDAYTTGYTMTRTSNRYVEVEPNVIDLTDYFTPEELQEFGERFGADGPLIVDGLIRKGLLVPSDELVLDEVVEDRTSRTFPFPPFVLLDDPRSPLTASTDVHMSDEAIAVTLDGDRFLYDSKDGTPLGAELFADGELVSTYTVTPSSR